MIWKLFDAAASYCENLKDFIFCASWCDQSVNIEKEISGEMMLKLLKSNKNLSTLRLAKQLPLTLQACKELLEHGTNLTQLCCFYEGIRFERLESVFVDDYG